MKNKILIGMLFLSSCNMEETTKLDKSLKYTIEENNCMVALKTTTISDTKKIELTTQCHNTSALFYGKVMYDFVVNSKKEGLHFDMYSISSNSNQEILSFNYDELKIILEKKKLFDEIISDLQNKDLERLYGLLDEAIKLESNYENIVSTIEPALAKKYENFEGFTLTSEGTKDYISFSATANAIHRVLIMFAMDSSTDIIYGYSIE